MAVEAGTRAQDGDDRPAEERILAAVIEGLALLDPGELTIKRICARADVTPPTLYYHFGSKDGLLAAGVERMVVAWLDLLESTVPLEGDLEPMVDTALQRWAAMVGTPARPLAVFAWIALLAVPESEQVRAALLRAQERSVHTVRAALLPHVGPAAADDLSGIAVDLLIGLAVESHLSGDHAGVVDRRLAGLGRLVHLAAQAWAAGGSPDVGPAPDASPGRSGRGSPSTPSPPR